MVDLKSECAACAMHASGTYEFWNELLQGEVESPTIRFAGRTARYGWKQNAETIEVGTRVDEVNYGTAVLLYDTARVISWVPIGPFLSVPNTTPLALPNLLLLLYFV